jgi:ribosomal protein L24
MTFINPKTLRQVNNGDYCRVIAGKHAGKEGCVSDVHTSAKGTTTITVEQSSGVRFKTLAKSVDILLTNPSI